MVDSAYFYVINSQSFNWISSIFCIHIRDLVNMCMKKFHAEKMFFDNLTGFLT